MNESSVGPSVRPFIDQPLLSTSQSAVLAFANVRCIPCFSNTLRVKSVVTELVDQGQSFGRSGILRGPFRGTESK